MRDAEALGVSVSDESTATHFRMVAMAAFSFRGVREHLGRDDLEDQRLRNARCRKRAVQVASRELVALAENASAM